MNDLLKCDEPDDEDEDEDDFVSDEDFIDDENKENSMTEKEYEDLLAGLRVVMGRNMQQFNNERIRNSSKKFTDQNGTTEIIEQNIDRNTASHTVDLKNVSYTGRKGNTGKLVEKHHPIQEITQFLDTSNHSLVPYTPTRGQTDVDITSTMSDSECSYVETVTTTTTTTTTVTSTVKKILKRNNAVSLHDQTLRALHDAKTDSKRHNSSTKNSSTISKCTRGSKRRLTFDDSLVNITESSLERSLDVTIYDPNIYRNKRKKCDSVNNVLITNRSIKKAVGNDFTKDDPEYEMSIKPNDYIAYHTPTSRPTGSSNAVAQTNGDDDFMFTLRETIDPYVVAEEVIKPRHRHKHKHKNQHK